jgi:leucyl-tRNA synthetase
MVLAPEHALVERITAPERRAEVQAYVKAAQAKSERLRQAELREKSGVDTGARALNPCSGEAIPVWVADYVLAGYGTGAIMAVPAHDERDFEFAQALGLPVRQVVEAPAGQPPVTLPYTGEGVNVRSGLLDGLPTPQAKRRMIEWLESHSHGSGAVTYKLRDWLFSRQRYWGEPFPVLHLEDGSVKLVPESELPVLLPELDDFRPSGGSETPLERARDWIATVDPASGRPARRDRNVMPQWAGSCWYYLRFCDPTNDAEPFSREAEQAWMPVDLYVGGAEHAVLHLLYARFWHKVLYDLGLVHTKEPFRRLVNQGMILGYSYRYYDTNVSDDPQATPRCFPASAVRVEGERAVALATGQEVKARWVLRRAVRWSEDQQPLHPTIDDLVLEEVVEKMSKSRGNTISPDEVIAEYGADAMRLYEMFLGPLEKGAPWSTEGIQGVHRFLQRTWRTLVDEDAEGEPLRELAAGRGTREQQRLLARTIQGVGEDLESLALNTAISKLMVFVRDIAKEAPLPREAAESFVLLLAPFAPHLAEELWQRLGHGASLAREPWPAADPAFLSDDVIKLAVQVNGKRRDEIEVPAGADEATLRAAALAAPNVQRHLGGRTPKKVIVVPGRLVNVVG